MQRLAVWYKQVFYTGCASLVLMTASSSSLAVTVEEIPNPRQANGDWVSDTANLLNASTENKLNQIISQLEAKNGTEIAVVTVPNTAPSKTPKAFAMQLFNHWKIGKAAQDNGVLFLISKGDRRVEIETGYGIEVVLPNAQVSEIIQQKIVPSFKKGNFDQGTLNGTNALIATLATKTFPAHSSAVKVPFTPSAISTNPSPSPSSSQPNAFIWVPFLGFIFIGSLLFGLIALANSRNQNDNHDRRGDGRRHRASSHASSNYYGGVNTSGNTGSSSSGSVGSSSSGGSGGSTGGGDFGGGSSGGGGAGGGF